MTDRPVTQSSPGGSIAPIGQRQLRREDRRLLCGSGRFIEDIVLAGELRAEFLRSPHAHARITGMDTSAAEGARGVRMVLTGIHVRNDGLGGVPWEVRPPADTPGNTLPPLGSPEVAEPQPLIADDIVRYTGEIVAMVIADSDAEARDAAELINVDYQPLSACADTHEAASVNQPPLWPDTSNNHAFTIRLGDASAVDQAFADATHVETLDCESNRIFGAPIENRGYIGDYDPVLDRMVLHAPAGKPHSIRKTMADQVFHVPREQIAVKVPDIGGGFGIKNVLYPEACLVIWAARRVGRPVKWIGRRDEGLLSDVGCREQSNHGEMALDPDGRILAIRVRSTGNLGAYLAPRGVVSLRNSGFVIPNVYAVPHIDYEMRALYSNTAPTCNFRGAGEPEGVNITERLADAAARSLQIDPFEFRRRNLLPASALPRVNPAGLGQDTGDYGAILENALEAADRDGFAARRAATEAEGKLRGLGVSMHLFMSGFNYTETTTLVVHEDGAVDLLIGSQCSGQGHATVFAQIAGAHLGIEADRIRVVQGDTDRVATGSGTGASRSLTIGGSSTVLAADKLIEEGRSLAAQVMEAAVEDVSYETGRFLVVGTDRGMGLAELARHAAGADVPKNQREGFTASASYQPENGTSAGGCQICEIEVDPETGSVSLDRFSMVQDVGRAINPMIVEGQVHGGVVTGLGQALCEHAIYEPGSAQLLTGSFMDYTLPRADLMPPIDLQLLEVPSANNPLGAKGIGEAGGIGAAPAVINAILDALAPLGVRTIDMPATPHRVWQAIRAAAESSGYGEGGAECMKG